MSFERQRLIGQGGEHYIEEFFIARGLYVIDMAAIESYRNRAPSLEGRQSHVVLPDLQVYGAEQRGWIEVKTKAQASWNRALRRFEHGLQQAHWHDYVRVEEQTGLPVWLCILELKDSTGALNPRVLLQRVTTLDVQKRAYDGAGMPDHKPYYFFHVDAFGEEFGPTQARVPLPEPDEPTAARSLKDGARPPQIRMPLDVSGLGAAADARDLHAPPVPRPPFGNPRGRGW